MEPARFARGSCLAMRPPLAAFGSLAIGRIGAAAWTPPR
jgi:hypothetical protein